MNLETGRKETIKLLQFRLINQRPKLQYSIQFNRRQKCKVTRIKKVNLVEI